MDICDELTSVVIGSGVGSGTDSVIGSGTDSVIGSGIDSIIGSTTDSGVGSGSVCNGLEVAIGGIGDELGEFRSRFVPVDSSSLSSLPSHHP